MTSIELYGQCYSQVTLKAAFSYYKQFDSQCLKILLVSPKVAIWTMRSDGSVTKSAVLLHAHWLLYVAANS